MIGERLKHAFTGNDAWILSYRDECFDQIGLKPSVKIPLFNGALECQFRKYQLFDGKYKAFRSDNEGEEFKPKREERAARPRRTGERVGYKKDGDRDRKPSFRGDRKREDGEGRERRSFDRKDSGERRSFSRERKAGDGKEFTRERRGEFKKEFKKISIEIRKENSRKTLTEILRRISAENQEKNSNIRKNLSVLLVLLPMTDVLNRLRHPATCTQSMI